MLKIYLARHGQDEDNRAGILNGHRNQPLTELGRAQAQELAAYVISHNLKFTKIYSSPLQRACETARCITQALNLPDPEIIPELIERDFGIMTGQPTADIAKMCAPDIIQADIITYFLNPEGAETFPDLIRRAKKLLAEIQARHTDGNILLVGHGDFGKMVYAAYYNLDWREVLLSFHFGNSELVLLAPDIKPKEAEIFKAPQYNH